MKNRIVGIIIIAISLLIGFIIFSFNKALSKIVNDSCSHGPTCPMWGTIDFHTNVGIGIMIFIIFIGLYLIFFGRDEKIVNPIPIKNINKEDYANVRNQLDDDEKLILDHILELNGSIFQSDLVDKTQFPKVKVTRILDKLEGRGIIERKRRGMTNIVILKV